MTANILSDAFGHHVWASIRLIDSCADLDEAKLATTVPGTYGSIIQTLRHIVGGDVFYLNVLRGGEPVDFDEISSDIPTMRAMMESHHAAWEAQISGDLDALTVIVEHEDGGYETHAPLGIRLAQALYHGTDHRSQVCTALTSLGIEPPAIQVWDYARLDKRFFTIESPAPADPPT